MKELYVYSTMNLWKNSDILQLVGRVTFVCAGLAGGNGPGYICRMHVERYGPSARL